MWPIVIPSHDLLNITHKLQVTRLDLIYMDSEYRRNGYIQLWLELKVTCAFMRGGNNNSWCQDQLNWFSWAECAKDRGWSFMQSEDPVNPMNPVKHENHEIVDFYTYTIIYIYNLCILYIIYIYIDVPIYVCLYFMSTWSAMDFWPKKGSTLQQENDGLVRFFRLALGLRKQHSDLLARTTFMTWLGDGFLTMVRANKWELGWVGLPCGY